MMNNAYRVDGDIVYITIPGITNEFIIDLIDLQRVQRHSWCRVKNANGSHPRAGSRIHGKIVLLHRFLLNAQPGQIVDHINQCVWDNRRSNIRLVSRADNEWNKSLLRSNRSGYKGVTARKDRPGKHSVQIGVNGKKIYLGDVADPELGALIYDTAKQFYHPTAPSSSFNFP